MNLVVAKACEVVIVNSIYMTFTPLQVSSLTSFEANKKAIERNITNALFDAVEKNQLPFEQLQSVAQTLWNELSSVNDELKLAEYVQSLGQKHSYLSSVTLTHTSQQKIGEQEKDMIEKLSQIIKSD